MLLKAVFKALFCWNWSSTASKCSLKALVQNWWKCVCYVKKKSSNQVSFAWQALYCGCGGSVLPELVVNCIPYLLEGTCWRRIVVCNMVITRVKVNLHLPDKHLMLVLKFHLSWKWSSTASKSSLKTLFGHEWRRGFLGIAKHVVNTNLPDKNLIMKARSAHSFPSLQSTSSSVLHMISSSFCLHSSYIKQQHQRLQ